MTGRRLGNYDILDKLGEGGMGQVWRAKDARLNRSVAVKILPADVAGDPVRRERFEQEARALGALNHPNIVAVYDIGQSDGQAYIVSELVDGEALRAVIERGPVTGRKLLDIATQTADGIAAAHALGIVHRDLKPENIMQSRDGRVKVLDFGLAKQNAPITTEETATIALSSPGMVLGTVGYMSPEQVRGEPVDARSDIFSFGCVLYEMASGKQPFAGKSAADVMSAVLREDPPDLDASVPSALGAILHRCLEKDPARRFQSAADLAFALRSIGHLTTSQTAIAAMPPAPARHPRHRWLFIALAAAGGFLLVAAGLFVGKRSAAPALPEYQRLTFREGGITNARFAPDRQNVVYAANWDMQESLIFIGAPGSPEARPLDIKGTRLLSLSSKGDLALLTGPFSPDGLGTLARASIGGAQPRALLENVRFADWSPDGSEMAVVRRVGDKLRLEYPIGKVLVESQWILAGIRVSPDGQRVAFGTFGGGGSSVMIVTVDRAGKVERLGVVSGQVGELASDYLSWTADGREVWFRSFDAGTRNTIFAIDLKGKQRVVTRLPGRVNLYDVAPDGRMLLSIGSGRLGVRGLAPGETVERDLSCLESSELRGITPDGRMVLVNIVGESGGAKGSIYWRMTDGSPPVRLGDGASFAISPDGKWVTGYSSRDTKKRRYVLMPTGAGEELSPEFPNFPGQTGIVLDWLGGEGNYLVGALSPAQKWQLFAWNRPSNAIRPASEEGLEDALPAVAPDGRQVLMPHTTRGWVVCDTQAATCKPIPGLSAHDQPVGWRSDNRTVYVTAHRDENRALAVSLVDTATGKRSDWKMIHPSIPVDSVHGLRVTPDGRAYAYNFSYGRSDLYLARGH
jgi:Tol biopolymer transport system component